MITTVLTYLRRNVQADTHTINSLFVSAFLKSNNLIVKDDGILHGLSSVDETSVATFICHLGNEAKFSLEELIHLFEFVISPSDKIVNGAIYTPKPIRSAIISHCLGDKTDEELRQVRVCDISCGCGGFLMDVAELIHERTGKSFADIFRENVYGIDIQQYSVDRTKILLSLLALTYGEDADFHFNIIQADTLDYRGSEWNPAFAEFDVIVGNPPYVCSRNVSERTKEKMLQYEVSRSGHPDLYISFFQIAVEMLNEDGRFGYITMNSFLRSVNGRALREYFSENHFQISILDFRGYQVFPSKSTYTCLFYLHKGVVADMVRYCVSADGKNINNAEYRHIPYFQLDNKKGWSLNDFVQTADIEDIGIPIGKYCQSRHGIATLSNKTYIFSPISEDDLYYFFVKSGKTFRVEKDVCRNVVNSNKLNSDVDFDTIMEKVIFPYSRNEDGRMSVIDEHTMEKKYPKAYNYLLSQRITLDKRDKGNTSKYPTWYAFGRTQSLQMPRFKLFFPKFANKLVNCVLKDDAELLLYNGIAFVCESEERLKVLKRIIESGVFWRYIVRNAKPYSSYYYSLSGVDIKNFGIPEFSDEQVEGLLALESKPEIDEWLQQFYASNGINISLVASCNVPSVEQSSVPPKNHNTCIIDGLRFSDVEDSKKK